MDKPEAMWNIELMCDCPKCGKWVDLLTLPDFWDGRRMNIGENTTDEEFTCPDCGHEFTANVVY